MEVISFDSYLFGVMLYLVGLLTLGAHARGLRYSLCVSVRPSVIEHLASGSIFRAINEASCSWCDERQSYCSDFG